MADKYDEIAHQLVIECLGRTTLDAAKRIAAEMRNQAEQFEPFRVLKQSLLMIESFEGKSDEYDRMVDDARYTVNNLNRISGSCSTVNSNVQNWRYKVIPMPLDAERQGPVGMTECTEMRYEVWDDVCDRHYASEFLADAIQEAVRLNNEFEMSGRPKRPYSELAAELSKVRSAWVGKRLLHKKTGNEYMIVGAVFEERTMEIVLLYGSASEAMVEFSRPIHEFNSDRYEVLK